MAGSKFNLRAIGEGIAGAAAIAVALLTPFLRSRRTKWGATDAEVRRSLPGDDLVPHPKWRWTHAVTIRASDADIWPWLVLKTKTTAFKAWFCVEDETLFVTARLLRKSCRSEPWSSAGCLC